MARKFSSRSLGRLLFEAIMSATDKVDYILRAKEAGFFIWPFFISTESRLSMRSVSLIVC